MRLHICTVPLLLMLCGCVHFSRLEVSSDNLNVLVEDATVLKKEVGDILAASKFAPVRDKWFAERKYEQPGFIDEWQRFENRGFWYGTECVRVEMYLDPNSIVVVVSSDEGGRRAVVEGIREMLERSIREKHPDLTVYVKSYSDFRFWEL